MTRSVWKMSYIDINIIKRFDELLLDAIAQFKSVNKIGDAELTKGFLKQNKLEILFIAKQLSEEEPIEVWSRRSVVSSEFLGFTFLVYNGRIFQKLVIKTNMLGKKFGEFATTKRIGPKIHELKKKKKK
jgi:small subunit ribosomal protein S19